MLEPMEGGRREMFLLESGCVGRARERCYYLSKGELLTLEWGSTNKQYSYKLKMIPPTVS